MMFKKQVLVLAMLAVSSAAFADNEAEISQDTTTATSLATVEQNTLGDNTTTDQLTGSYGQVIQNATLESTGQIYQSADPADDASVFDLSAGTPDSLSILAQNIVLPLDAQTTAFVSRMGSLGNSANNVAVIGQYGTDNGVASILQLTGAEDTASVSAIVYLPGVGNSLGNQTSGDITTDNPLGLTSGPATTIAFGAADNEYQDNFLVNPIVIGTGLGAGGSVNTNNLAVVDQGDLPLDRDGNELDDGSVTYGLGSGTIAYDDVAQVIQSGVGNTGVIIQAGDAQMASIYQDGLQNDAYIVQFGNQGAASGANDTTADALSNFAAVVQLASADVATIEQGGTQNTAYVLQY
jgi:uncharacterized protein YdeI (BOF family)